jgi:hypothetical protein
VIRIAKALVAMLESADHLARELRDSSEKDVEQLRIASMITALTEPARGWAVSLQVHIEDREAQK